MTSRITMIVSTRHAAKVEAFRESLAALAATRGESDLTEIPWPLPDAEIDGPSLATPGVSVTVRSGFLEVDELGSFAVGSRPMCVIVHVQGHRRAIIDMLAPVPGSAPIPPAEAEGWARAALGEHWGNFAYELATDDAVGTAYLVLIDGDGEPMLAPDNFSWARLWLPGVKPRKLVPAKADAALAALISAHGTYTDTQSIRDPRTDADGGWRIDIVGDPQESLSEVAAETFSIAVRRLRVRGAVGAQFRPVRISLDNDDVLVFFHWAKNPNLFAISFPLPTSPDELRNPPTHSPSGFVSDTLEGWMEEFATGLMLRGPRRLIDGIIHISAPAHAPHSGIWINLVPSKSSGAWLAANGLHIDFAKAARDEGTLALWIQASTDGAGVDRFVGHAVSTWVADGIASLDVLEAVPGSPPATVQELAGAITEALANAGALTVITPLTNPALTALGYRADASRGGMRCAVLRQSQFDA